MNECNAIVEVNNEIDRLKKKNEKLNALCVQYGFDMGKLEEKYEQCKQAYQTLKHRHSLLHDECLEVECDRDSLKKDVILLEKENEQLKEKNKKVNERNLCSNSELSHYRNQYWKIIQCKQQLEKENENQNNILEDFMLMLNRLQANPNDKILQSMSKDMLRMMGKDIMGDSE